MTATTVGVVGLGRMGGNMARRLLEAGVDVIGTDLDETAVAALESAGGESRPSPAAVAGESDVVVSSLPDPPTVEAVYTAEDGLLSGADEETVILETSTIDPDTIESLAATAGSRNVDVLGAPVSGGPEDSRRGTLTIIVGGDRSTFEREDVTAVLEALGGNVYYAGGVDAGHTLKLMNNVMSMGNLLLAMEAVSLGAERGVDGEVMFEVLSNAGGASNQFEKRVPRALNRNFEPGFPVDLGRKDLGLAIETATGMDLPMQAASAVHRLFVAASARGYGDEDAAAVVKLFEECTDAIVEADGRIDETFQGY